MLNRNLDFTPRQKSFLNAKFRRLEKVLTESSISTPEIDKNKLRESFSHTVVGELKPIGESVLKEGKKINGRR